MSKRGILFSIVFAAVCFLAPISSTQTVQETPKTPQQSQPAPIAQDDVVRVSTELVQTDVTVVDKQGRFVEGLDRDNFELRINGKEQPIAFFERVIAGSSKERTLLTSRRAAQQSATERVQPTPAIEGSAALGRGRTTFIFVDDHHLTPSSMTRTRDVLLRYVDEVMGPEDQALIATASGQLGFLQQLTGDRNILRTAVKRLTYRSFSASDTMSVPPMTEYQAVAIENGDRDALSYFIDQQCEEFKRMGRGTCAPNAGMTNNAIFDDAVARSGRSATTTSGTSPGPLPADPNLPQRGRQTSATGNVLRPEAERSVRSRAHMIALQAARVTLNTLGSLESLIRTSAPISERKLVIFVSDGFFLNYLNSTNAYDLRRIADAALRAGTVIYTIDARGLVTGSIDASTKDNFDPQGRTVRMAIAEVSAAQDPLYALANDTGGRALLNTNDLQKGILNAIQETSGYYLLAWRPETTDVAKDRFRRIEVKIKDHPDLTVRLRSGFFAEDPSAVSSANTPSTISVDDLLIGVIRAAYRRAGIPVILSLGYLDKVEEGLTLAASVQIERDSANSSEGQRPQGAELDVMGAVIDDGGKILSSLKQKVTIPTDQSANAKIMVLTLQFPKIAPGLRQVRLAARDSRSGRIGSAWQWIDIPDLAKAGLSLSSIFLSEGQSSGSQSVVLKPDAQFNKTQKLRFQTYLYHAAPPSNVTMQLELRLNGEMITQTPVSPVPAEGVKDLTRLPIVGEFPLQNFTSGQYELRIIVTDQSTKKSASQQVKFVIE